MRRTTDTQKCLSALRRLGPLEQACEQNHHRVVDFGVWHMLAQKAPKPPIFLLRTQDHVSKFA